MRVLYVSHTALVSGAEMTLFELISALPGDVEAVLACPRGDASERGRATGVEVHELPPITGGMRLHPVQTSRALREMASAAKALRRVVRELNPDVIHANSIRAGIVAGRSGASRMAPLILHQHDDLPRTLLGRSISRLVDRSVDSTIAVSAYSANCLTATGFRGEITVLHNPIDRQRFDPDRCPRSAARERLGFSDHDQIVGIVGQITPWKGHDTVIRAIAELRHDMPRARLIIVGEPKFVGAGVAFDNLAYLDSLRGLVEELGLRDQVEFWGERSDVVPILRAIDVLAAPSWHEPFGRSIAEAMAMETPVIATIVGGPSEFVEPGVCGLLCAPRNVSAWASAIGELLSDPSRRIEMGRRARQTSLQFDPETYAKNVVGVYRRTRRRRSRQR